MNFEFAVNLQPLQIVQQGFCWTRKSSGHFPNFTTFTIIMIIISHTFQYKNVLKIFKISIQKYKTIGQKPGENNNIEYICTVVEI